MLKYMSACFTGSSLSRIMVAAMSSLLLLERIWPFVLRGAFRCIEPELREELVCRRTPCAAAVAARRDAAVDGRRDEPEATDADRGGIFCCGCGFSVRK
jgi:hypothetical protein